jgi:2-keto-4-pentenoate hydratase
MTDMVASLLAAEREGGVLAKGAFAALADLDAAEALQDAFLAEWGEEAGAWKLGATTRVPRERLGLARGFIGLVPRRRMLADGASLSLSSLRQRIFELEIAFVLGADLPVRPEPWSEAEIAAAIAGVTAAFELPQSRFAIIGGEGGLALVADNGAAGFAVIGGPINPDWTPQALAQARFALSIGESVAHSGSAEEIIGGPFGAFVESVEQARARGHGFRRGQAVLTGACAAVVDPPPGAALRGEITGVGAVALDLL